VTTPSTAQRLAQPIRYPDAGAPHVMTRRAWWLLALNFLIPGSAQVLAGNRRLGRFGLGATIAWWILIVATAVVWFASQNVLITVLTNAWALWVVQGIVVFYAVLWIILTIDTLRLVRLVRMSPAWRVPVALVVVLLLVGIGGAGAYGVMALGVTRTTVGEVFAGTEVEPPIDGRYNVLLLGGDAGPDREGMRPDSITVASVDAETGETVLIGLPRELAFAPFSADSPMAELYPNGYGAEGCEVDVCYLNSIYTEVELYWADRYPDAASRGSSPGIEATKDAAEGVTGLTIQYTVLIDMYGFASLIDALGGITINVEERLPIGGSEDLSDVGAWIEPGVHHMDGNTALWYARSRHSTSDYDRMVRQRNVQEAILRQFDPATVLARFQEIAAAGAQVVRTDVPQSMLGTIVDLAMKAKDKELVRIELTPVGGIDPEWPDYAYIHEIIAAATAPPVEEPAE